MDVFIKKGKPTPVPTNPIAWLIWCFFGNARDGYIGDRNWNPEQIDNLVFIVLGCETVDSIRFGFPYARGVFRPDGGWNFAFSKTTKMIYPFVSYIGVCKFYIGWRESGNFGIKLTRNSNWTPKEFTPQDDRVAN
jgi:hypothetical protein